MHLLDPNLVRKIPLNVNIVKQDLLNKKQFLKILWSEVWMRGFQLMQILGLLGMYSDAVVCSRSSEEFTFFQIGSGHTVLQNKLPLCFIFLKYAQFLSALLISFMVFFMFYWIFKYFFYHFTMIIRSWSWNFGQFLKNFLCLFYALSVLTKQLTSSHEQ